MSPLAPQTPTFPQVVLWEHVAPLFATVDRLEKELAQIKRLQSEWVDTKEAKAITGIKSCAALKRQRERANSPIIVRLEGTGNKTPMYLRASLHAYCESKVLQPAQPGRNLAA